MRAYLTTWALMIATAAPLCAASKPTDFDWDRLRDLPVQAGGRRKPLDTLAWEVLRVISNQTSVVDPETGEKLHATAAYLCMLFDWQGWDHPDRDRMSLHSDVRSLYFQWHEADKWDQAPLLRVDYLELRATLGLQEDQKYVSPSALSTALISDPRSGAQVSFSAWGNQLLSREEKGAPLTELEKKGLELANRLWTYQKHRMGRGLEILPIPGSNIQAWTPIAHLLLTHFDDASDPSGQYRQAQRLVLQARSAYQKNDVQTFNSLAAELKPVLRGLGEELGEYPSELSMALEVAYNHWAPFRFAWVFMLLAALAMLLNLGSGWRIFSAAALSLYALGLIAMVTGFALRIAISGRPPVSNMYESVIYVGFGVAVFGLIFELIYRSKYILTAAAMVSTVALVLADNCPAILDPSLRPLVPVLRSNFWLVIHVMTITLSYAAFALAMGIGNITLGYLLMRSSNGAAIAALNRFTYKAIQVGVLLLAAGTILGGVWADYSWGRFWGWDPKEVWALVALLGYLAVLHARFAGWVGQRGLAALSVVCFCLVVMAWYGVNFVLGAGLHSYGFGGGGRGWVYAAVVFNLLYAGLALLRSRARAPDVEPPAAPQVTQTRITSFDASPV
ncbi:MAG: cytochrome c biogenesis protein CcsA [Gemmataceae bacterium]